MQKPWKSRVFYRLAALSELRSSQLSYTPGINEKSQTATVWLYPRL
jgi:hypothetical protein